MVRSYKRTSHRAEYSHDSLTECLNAVRDKTMSLREASRNFNIPRSTIQKRLKSANPDGAKKLGPISRVFTDDMETQLKRRVLEMESTFYGITMTDLRRAAYDFAEGNNINHRFNRVNRLAGKDWVLDFNRRHHISVRTPQSTSMNRVLAFDRDKVLRFFDLLKLVYDRDKIPAHRVYNLDETGITSVPKPGKILALTGRKQVGRIASGEKGRTVTVVAAISASGQFIPPCMIFPRKRMSDRLLADAVPGTIGYVSGNGWIDSSLFVLYLDHFVQYTHASKENKVLLIVDNHISHKSIEAIEKANEKGIVLLTLPPHTSSKLQPLDHSVFRSLKINYSHECAKWMTNHHGKKITEYDMAAILKPAFLKSMTPSNIISGFQSTGIYPYNPDVITEDDYTAADAARGLDRCSSRISSSNPQPSTTSVVASPEGNTTSGVVASTEADNNPQPSTTSVVASPSFASLDSICPIRKRNATFITPRRRTAEQADIVTDSPYKKRLIYKKKEKECKAALVEKKKKDAEQKKKDAAEKKRAAAEKRNAKVSGKRPSRSIESIAKNKKQHAGSTNRPASTDPEDCECLYCSELFSSSKNNEQWIKCDECQKWSHENCTDYKGDKGFLCDFCR